MEKVTLGRTGLRASIAGLGCGGFSRLGLEKRGVDHSASLVRAAYRFCRHARGVHVVLTGTGNPAHLKENIASISKPELPAGILKRLEDMFGNVDCVSGQ